MPMQNYTQYYAYDEAGNITELRHQAAAGSYTRDYQYSSTNNQLQSSYGGMYTYTHDPDQGYITSMPHLPLMDWNYKDELVAVSRQQGANPEITYYQYDSQGRRLRKVTEYQGSGPPPGQKDQRIYLEGYEYYENFNSGEQIHSLSLKDERQSFVMVEKTNIPGHLLLVRYLHDSHQGSCTLETDESGNVITYEEYHPFGTSSYQATNAGILSSSKRYRFCAKERDSESGLYYYGARYYVPWLCRFISCDPKAAETPQQSPYNYCNNNPINLIDPDGQQAVEPDDPPQGDGGDKIYNGGVFPEVVITGVKELTEADIENMGAGTEFSLFKAVTDYENYSKEEDFSNLGTYSKNLTQSNEPYHPNPNYHGDRKTYYNDLFVANENYNFSNFASVTMGNLISGEGPENTVFGKDHSINQFMSQIDIVRDAVAQWKTENSELSFEQQQPLNEFFHYEPSNAVMDLIDSFFTGREFTTPEQVIGSANVQITPIKEGVLEISVFNVTSIGSGNIENGRSYMRQPNFEGKQSYRNIIQTFNFNYYLR